MGTSAHRTALQGSWDDRHQVLGRFEFSTGPCSGACRGPDPVVCITASASAPLSHPCRYADLRRLADPHRARRLARVPRARGLVDLQPLPCTGAVAARNVLDHRVSGAAMQANLAARWTITDLCPVVNSSPAVVHRTSSPGGDVSDGLAAAGPRRGGRQPARSHRPRDLRDRERWDGEIPIMRAGAFEPSTGSRRASIASGPLIPHLLRYRTEFGTTP